MVADDSLLLEGSIPSRLYETILRRRIVETARFGFRLPRYLRDAPFKGEDGKRLKLLQVLVPSETPPAQQP